jgi:hypothetical protein
MKTESNESPNRFYRLITAEFQRELENASDAQRTVLLNSARSKDGEVELRVSMEAL